MDVQRSASAAASCTLPCTLPYPEKFEVAAEFVDKLAEGGWGGRQGARAAPAKHAASSRAEQAGASICVAGPELSEESKLLLYALYQQATKVGGGGAGGAAVQDAHTELATAGPTPGPLLTDGEAGALSFEAAGRQGLQPARVSA